MIIRVKKAIVKPIIAAFLFTLIVGCSSASEITPSSQNPPASAPITDTAQELLLNMKKLADQGKVINADFPVKTSNLEDVKRKWGEPDKTDWVPAAKGSYSTYSNHEIVIGFNKGLQIFEVRSFDKQLQIITLAKAKEIYGSPAYDVKANGEEIIGYAAGGEFKIELVFPQPTSLMQDPILDHYLVLYPQGTVNSMANDPGRQW